MNDDLRTTLFSIIRRETAIDLSTVDPTLDLRSTMSIDSVQFIGIIANLETELQIALPLSIIDVSSIEEFLGVIEKALLAPSPENPPCRH